MNVYVAGPLFSEAEQAFNRRVRDELVAAGHEVFLPQEEAAALVGTGPHWQWNVFICDRAGVHWCDALVAIMDGAQVDDGTAWECGYAYAIGKHLLGLRTDFRKGGDGPEAVNLMLSESAIAVCTNVGQVLTMLERCKP